MSDKKEMQQLLASLYNKENMHLLLDDCKESLMTLPRQYIAQWKAKEIDFVARPDLIEVAAAIHKLDSDSIMWQMLTTVLLDMDASLQQLMGMFWTRIGEYVPMPYRRGHVLNVYIEAVCASGLVQIKRMGKYNHLVAIVSMGDRGQQNYSYTLPSLCKHNVKDNQHTAYGSMNAITGGNLKQHEGELVLDHLQRLNDIAYKVEDRIFKMTKPKFDETKKFKEKAGRFETDEEVAERYKDFQRFQRELPTRVKIMQDNGNEFYLAHRYDVRLRTYLKAYHFDFVGNKYARAFVQPAKGEMVQGVEEYL